MFLKRSEGCGEYCSLGFLTECRASAEFKLILSFCLRSRSEAGAISLNGTRYVSLGRSNPVILEML